MVAVFRTTRPSAPLKPDPHAAVRQRLGLAKTRRQPVTLAGSVQDALTGGHTHKTQAPWGSSRYSADAHD